MWAATAWDDSDWDGAEARGWTVMGRVRERQLECLRRRSDARKRIRDEAGSTFLMTPAVVERQYRDRLAAQWAGEFTVLALLFAMPDESALRTLDERGDYFDVRTGDTWDLFFPGYFRSEGGAHFEEQAGSRPVGSRKEWYFNPSGFDMLRRHVEDQTGGMWTYDGSAELVLLNVYVPDRGDPTIDWSSVQAGRLTANGERSLAWLVEKITRDLEQQSEDKSYGVGELVDPSAVRTAEGSAKQVMVSAAGDIVATLATRLFGMSP